MCLDVGSEMVKRCGDAEGLMVAAHLPSFLTDAMSPCLV